MTLSLRDAGPSVQTIFVRGIDEAKITSEGGSTGRDTLGRRVRKVLPPDPP